MFVGTDTSTALDSCAPIDLQQFFESTTRVNDCPSKPESVLPGAFDVVESGSKFLELRRGDGVRWVLRPEASDP
jgi:hypothetical protein